MTKIAIVGSRPTSDMQKNWQRREQVFAYVAALPKDTIIVSGGASGVDTWAVQAGRLHGLPKPIVHIPEWKKYGKSAGMIRNQLIVDDADSVTAFWDGISSGTKNTIERARKAGKPLTIINPEAA